MGFPGVKTLAYIGVISPGSPPWIDPQVFQVVVHFGHTKTTDMDGHGLGCSEVSHLWSFGRGKPPCSEYHTSQVVRNCWMIIPKDPWMDGILNPYIETIKMNHSCIGKYAIYHTWILWEWLKIPRYSLLTVYLSIHLQFWFGRCRFNTPYLWTPKLWKIRP